MSNLLTITAAAEQLGTDSLHIMRAHARGNLAASRIGESGPLRILSDHLAAYVAKGAPDFDMPKLSSRNGPTWFDENERSISALAATITGSLRDELKAIADSSDEPAVNIAKAAVKMNQPMRAIVRSRPAVLATIKTARPQPEPFANSLELLMVHAIRATALNIVRRSSKKADILSVLYADAASYQRIVSTAAADALAQPVRYQRLWPSKASHWAQPHAVSFEITLGDLVEGNPVSFITRIASLAF